MSIIQHTPGLWAGWLLVLTFYIGIRHKARVSATPLPEALRILAVGLLCWLALLSLLLIFYSLFHLLLTPSI